MEKHKGKIIAGGIALLLFLIGWEIYATQRHREDMAYKVHVREAFNGALNSERKSKAEIIEEIEAEERLKGNPYSLFR